jgi:alcohol oxidase
MLTLDWLQTGRRSDSAHGYIHATRAQHSNLYLACNTKVDKVIIENGRAVGVKTVYVTVPSLLLRI